MIGSVVALLEHNFFLLVLNNTLVLFTIHVKQALLGVLDALEVMVLLGGMALQELQERQGHLEVLV